MNRLSLHRDISNIYLEEFFGILEDWNTKLGVHLATGDEEIWKFESSNGIITYLSYTENCRIILRRSAMVDAKQWYLPDDKSKRMMAYGNIVKYIRDGRALCE